jgi:hypothetical protein
MPLLTELDLVWIWFYKDVAPTALFQFSSLMKKRELKITPKHLLEQIKKLRNELFVANVQFDLYVSFNKTAPAYKEEIGCSPLFWDYTMKAHIDMVVLRLCRLYDPDPRTLSLPNFIKTIEANREIFTKAAFIERNKNNLNLERQLEYNRELSSSFLEEAKKICNECNPMVKELLMVRRYLVAHLNRKLAFDDIKHFQKRFPLIFENIGKLIENGFDLLNNVSSVFGGSVFDGTKNTNYPFDDFKFILETIKMRLKRREGKMFEDE